MPTFDLSKVPSFKIPSLEDENRIEKMLRPITERLYEIDMYKTADVFFLDIAYQHILKLKSFALNHDANDIAIAISRKLELIKTTHKEVNKSINKIPIYSNTNVELTPEEEAFEKKQGLDLLNHELKIYNDGFLSILATLSKQLNDEEKKRLSTSTKQQIKPKIIKEVTHTFKYKGFIINTKLGEEEQTQLRSRAESNVRNLYSSLSNANYIDGNVTAEDDFINAFDYKELKKLKPIIWVGGMNAIKNGSETFAYFISKIKASSLLMNDFWEVATTVFKPKTGIWAKNVRVSKPPKNADDINNLEEAIALLKIK